MGIGRLPFLRLLRIACLALTVGATASPPKATSLVVVLYGDTALLSPSTKNYTMSRARSLARALDEAGVQAGLYADREINVALSRPCRVAHIVSFEKTSASQMKALSQFVVAGGQLIVYGSPSEDLGRLMGVSSPTIIKAEAAPWTNFRFEGRRPLNSPDRLLNRSFQVIGAILDPARTSVLARWYDAQGKAGPPAVVRTACGLWVTKILLDEGSADDRRQFIAALSADKVPEIWRHAAKRLDVDLWKTYGVTSFEEACRLFRAQVRDGKRKALEDELAAATHLVRAKEADFSKGLFGASMPRLWALRHVMERAWATTQNLSVGGSILAVWDKSGAGLFPGSWASTATVLRKAGVTDLYVMADVPGHPLKAAVDACKPYGIRVHAWIPALTLEPLSAEARQAFIAAGRGLVNAQDRPVEWMNPANTLNRQEIARKAIRIAKESGAYGIHFDYMRYPLEEAAMGQKDRQAFEKWLGRRVASWPADVRPKGTLRMEYNAWRASHVTELMDVVSREIRKSLPKILLTVAVFGTGGTDNSVGQHWHGWIKRGLVDYLVPMNYTPDAQAFATMVEEQVGQTRAPSRIVCGIGLTSYEANLTSRETIGQILEARRRKTRGVAIYHLDDRFRTEIVPALELAR